MKRGTTKIDDLFSLRMGLTRTGDVKMEMDYVDADLFTKTMDESVPEFQDTFKIASLLRYLKVKGDEIMDKSNGYIS